MDSHHIVPGNTMNEGMFDPVDKHAKSLKEKLARKDADPNAYNIGDLGKNCLSYWFPKIVKAGVPVPATRYAILGNYDDMGVMCFDRKERQSVIAFSNLLIEFAHELGWPCFLRTGQFSGKHNWNQTCFVQYPSDMLTHMITLAEMQEIVGVMAPYSLAVWVIREMLPTKPAFRCKRYRGFPMTRELRVFVDGPRVVYSTPYWPEGAIEEGMPDTNNWRELLPSITKFSDEEMADLESLASWCGHAVGGRWSIDILDTENGWYVTDMAVAEMSYGYDASKFDSSTIDSSNQPVKGS